MTRGSEGRPRTLALLAAGALAAQVLSAQEASSPGRDQRLEVHLFLTQAFATARFADGGFFAPHADEANLGIPEGGTTDYRSLAVQLRYELTPKDSAIVQLSHRRFGFSPLTEVEGEAELDWAFYEHRFAEGTAVKVGRVQIPFGIFNQVRDVGTLLPFFRAPFSFYREVSFTSETVDGVLASRRFFTASPWSLMVEVYGGGWNLIEQRIDRPELVVAARAEDALGSQLWLKTPMPGFRLGLGGQRYSVAGGLFRRPGETTTFRDLHLSAEALVGRFVARAEARELTLPVTFATGPPLGFVRSDARYRGAYLQLGARAGHRFRVYAQAERAAFRQASPRFAAAIDLDPLRQDLGLALHYLLAPEVVLKVESHWTEFEQVALEGATPDLRLRFRERKATGGRYSIVSLSASW